MPNQTVELDGHMQMFLEENASSIEGRYYFLPFWFEKIEDGMFMNAKYKLHRLDNLPEELKSLIEKQRQCL